MRTQNTRAGSTGRLKGAEFEPERAALSARRRERKQKRADRRHARGTGAVEAHGIKFEGELAALPHHDVINHERDQEIADINYVFGKPLNATLEEHDRSEQEKEHADRDIDEDLRPRQAEAQTRLDKVKDRVGVGLGALIAAGLICFIANLGVDYGAVSTLPMPQMFQWLIVVGLGLATVWVAHLAAVQMARLAELHESQEEQPALYRQHKVALLVTTILPVLGMIAFTILRAANYSAEAQLSGVSLNIAALALGLLALAVLTYAIALYTGFRFEWLRPKRDAEDEVRLIDAQIAAKQRNADAAEIRMQQAVNQQEHLEYRRDETIEAAMASARARHARFDQDRRIEATRPGVADAKAERKAAGRRGGARPEMFARPRAARLDDLPAAVRPEGRGNGHSNN